MNKLKKLKEIYDKHGLSRAFFKSLFTSARRMLRRYWVKLLSISAPEKFRLSRLCCWSDGSGDTAPIYLSFDVEWYRPKNLEKILDELEKRNVKATFFLLGAGMENNAPLVHRILAQGHGIGNHTVTHPALPNCSVGKMSRELKTCAETYRAITGLDMPKLIRPPYGEMDAYTALKLRKMGYKVILWNTHVPDYLKKSSAQWKDFQNCLDTRLRPGSIILQHSFSNQTAQYIGRFVDACLEKGCRFALLEELPGE